jgi:K+-transporting ATPase ATPase A chain
MYILKQKAIPAIDRMGISQNIGSMEGKGSAVGFCRYCALERGHHLYFQWFCQWHARQPYMPLSGGVVLLDMMINALYGGVGVGLLNYYIFIIIAVFISGLMVGRTPEFLGHKVEAREVKIAALVWLLTAFLVKGGTALAAYYGSTSS